MLGTRLPLPAFDQLLRRRRVLISSTREAQWESRSAKLFASIASSRAGSATLWVARRGSGSPSAGWAPAIDEPVAPTKPAPTRRRLLRRARHGGAPRRGRRRVRRADDKGARGEARRRRARHGGVTVDATPRRTVVRVAQLAAAKSKRERVRSPAVARVRGRRRYTHEGCSGLPRRTASSPRTWRRMASMSGPMSTRLA